MKLCRALWIFPEFFLFMKELIKAPKKLLSIKRIASWLSLASLQVYWFKNYQDLIKDNQVPIILYSYWMNAFALGIGLIKEKYLENAYAISRAHRYDLYEDRPDNPVISTFHSGMVFWKKLIVYIVFLNMGKIIFKINIQIFLIKFFCHDLESCSQIQK